MAAFYKPLRLAFGYSAVLLISKGLTLLTSYLVAFSVDNTEFGYFSLAQACFAAAVVFFGCNSSTAYVRYYYSKGAFAVFRSLRRFNWLLFGLTVFSTLLLYFIFSEHTYYVWFSLLPLSGFLTAHVSSVNAICRCSNDLRGYASAELGRPLLVFSSLVYVLNAGLDFSVVVAYLLLLCASLLFVVLYSSFRLRSELFKDSNTFLPEKEVVSYLLPLFLVQLMALLNSVGDRYILTAFVTMEEIGRYGKAYLIGSAVGMLVDSFSLLWSPYVVRKRDCFKEEMYFKTVLVFGCATCLSLLFLLLAGFVYFYRVEFFSVDYLFWVMAITVLSAYMARVGYQVFVPVLLAFDQTGVVAKLSLPGAICGVVANFALIPLIGAVGAAISTWLSFFTFSALSFYCVRKRVLQV